MSYFPKELYLGSKEVYIQNTTNRILYNFYPSYVLCILLQGITVSRYLNSVMCYETPLFLKKAKIQCLDIEMCLLLVEFDNKHSEIFYIVSWSAFYSSKFSVHCQTRIRGVRARSKTKDVLVRRSVYTYLFPESLKIPTLIWFSDFFKILCGI